jgi:hypothetical protein
MRPYRTPSPFALQDPPGAELRGAAAAVAGMHHEEDRRRQLAALAELLVEAPAPGSDRWFHADLAHRTAADLRRERALLRLALLLHPTSPPAWWLERLRALDGALRR